jgi:hypothetical protein
MSGNLSNIDTCIENCNKIIFMLDEYEDARELHISEWNFRRIIKERYLHLSDCKRDIWKNRCTIRWAKLGDENTSFFTPWPLFDIDRTISPSLLCRMGEKLVTITRRLPYYILLIRRDWVRVGLFISFPSSRV